MDPIVRLIEEGTDPPVVAAWRCGGCRAVGFREEEARACCVPARCACGAPASHPRGGQCYPCRAREASRTHVATQSDRRARAVVVPEAALGGAMVVWDDAPDHPGDGYFADVAAVIEYAFDHDVSAPPFVWATTPMTLWFDAQELVDGALENWHDGAGDHLAAADLDELQAFLSGWCGRVSPTLRGFEVDRTRVVVVTAADVARWTLANVAYVSARTGGAA